MVRCPVLSTVLGTPAASENCDCGAELRWERVEKALDKETVLEDGMKAMRAEDAIVLEPTVFARVVLAGIAAGENSQQGDPLSVERVESDGSPSMLQVPDSPHSRAAFAIKRELPNDEKAFRGALARFNALMNLFSRDALGPWAQLRDGGNTAMHPAVIDVASSMRLSPNGRFAPRKFVAAVAETARRLYPDLQGW